MDGKDKVSSGAVMRSSFYQKATQTEHCSGTSAEQAFYEIAVCTLNQNNVCLIFLKAPTFAPSLVNDPLKLTLQIFFSQISVSTGIPILEFCIHKCLPVVHKIW